MEESIQSVHDRWPTNRFVSKIGFSDLNVNYHEICLFRTCSKYACCSFYDERVGSHILEESAMNTRLHGFSSADECSIDRHLLGPQMKDVDSRRRIRSIEMERVYAGCDPPVEYRGDVSPQHIVHRKGNVVCRRQGQGNNSSVCSAYEDGIRRWKLRSPGTKKNERAHLHPVFIVSIEEI